MDDKEEILIHRCKQGDITAFEILISDYEKKVYNIAYGLVGNKEDANDIAQDTFIKAFKSIHTFRQDSSFSTWIYRITVNTGKDFLRKAKKNISIEDIKHKKLQTQDEFERLDDRQMCLDALNQLQEEYKNVIVLKDIQGFTYQEIGEILNINIGTVKSRISRGRYKLKDILIENKEDFSY